MRSMKFTIHDMTPFLVSDMTPFLVSFGLFEAVGQWGEAGRAVRQ